MRASRFRSIVRGMSGKRVLVLGDLMIDEYIFGETKRISREAPVLILQYRGRHIGFGGASNAVANIASFGGAPLPVGCVGKDENGRDLIGLFNSLGIDTDGIIVDAGAATVCKTRISAGGMHTVRQQIVRIDREPAAPPAPDAVIGNIKKAADAGIDALLVSDYGCGALSPKVVRFINTFAGRGVCPVAIDSRYQLHRFRNPTLAAPNEEEAGIHAGHGADDIAAIDRAGESLRRKLKAKAVLVTRGSEGISLFEAGCAPRHIPVFGGSVAVDTTGAGDTVATAALLAICAGASFAEAAEIANRAGGLVVMKRGAATVSKQELLDTLE